MHASDGASISSVSPGSRRYREYTPFDPIPRREYRECTLLNRRASQGKGRAPAPGAQVPTLVRWALRALRQAWEKLSDINPLEVPICPRCPWADRCARIHWPIAK